VVEVKYHFQCAFSGCHEFAQILVSSVCILLFPFLDVGSARYEW